MKKSETCKTCGRWRGLHNWEDMRCPANGHEDGLYRMTTYNEGTDDIITAQAETIERLKEALEATEKGIGGLLKFGKQWEDELSAQEALKAARALLAELEGAK